ncbi:MAG: SDR family oxidoreductase [Chthonomonadales bacterium]
MQHGLILLTGATGYVGGRLLRVLQDSGRHVRCIARRPDALAHMTTPVTEIVAGDLLDVESLKSAMVGVHTAFYMVHSMGSASEFEELDRKCATNFAEAAKSAGVKRIVYLGGLGDSSEQLSTHLSSRQEVGTILRASGIQIIEFRASIVIGSGSLSFEMIRALSERLPVMIMPKWVSAIAQPIAITDVLLYLESAINLVIEGDQTFEIGGPDRLSYGDLMNDYNALRGLHRLMIKVPVLTPRLSSLWLGLVTPLYARVGRKLIDSIQHSTIVQDDSALKVFNIRPIGIKQAIALALRNEDREFAETRWSDAFSSGSLPQTWGGVRFGNRLVDSRSITVHASAEDAFRPIRRIGGNNGWYYANWLWKIRGFMDLCVGGIGVRRGRRNPETLVPGDHLDFWRVEVYEPDHILRLSAEMKLPGRAWLEFEVVEAPEGTTTIRQTALFDPVGLFGLIYWYSLFLFHELIFGNMLKRIGRLAVEKPTIE